MVVIMMIMMMMMRRRRRRRADRIRICEGTLALVRVQPCLCLFSLCKFLYPPLFYVTTTCISFDVIIVIELYQFVFVLFAMFNPFTASCENAMILSVPGVPESCEKLPHTSHLNFDLLNQFSISLACFGKH
jgi:hypothetical protein